MTSSSSSLSKRKKFNSLALVSSISHRDEIINNLIALRKNESFNDVIIILSDGVVHANMLSNDKFVEAQTKEVPMKEYGTRKPWSEWSTTSTAAT